MMPTESQVMLKLRLLIQHCKPGYRLIKFYENQATAGDAPQLDLPLFYCAESKSKLPPSCEYIDNTDTPHLQRYVLALLDSESRSLAAINFEIDLDQKKCTILLIETKSDSYRKRYGQLLLHSAMIASAMHGIGSFELETIREALAFYLKQGFCVDPTDISITDPESYQNVVMRFESHNPECIQFLNQQTVNYPAEFQLEHILNDY
jgi:hypothetical protein